MLMATVVAGFLFAGCGGDDEKRPAECEEIVAACHAVDQGSGPIHECHENAEETWTKDQCVMNRATCLATCAVTATDAGTQSDH